MLSGISGSNAAFLAGLNAIEGRISRTNQQITSGVRVSQASDDPGAISQILHYQQQLDQNAQVQTNLNTAKANATAADGALQTASQFLDKLISIAAQGASSTADASATNTRATLAGQVDQIQQQLVGLANTQVNGRYIFGGDNSSAAPYSYTPNANWGVTANFTGTLTSTETISDANGQTIVPELSAQQIFDTPPASAPTATTPTPAAPPAGNIFAAVGYLSLALRNNDQSSIQNATSLIKSAVSQLGQATTAIGNTETWIEQASSDASQRTTDATAALSSVRDTDIASAAVQLTMDQTALQAALAAHASFNNKSLFDYLG